MSVQVNKIFLVLIKRMFDINLDVFHVCFLIMMCSYLEYEVLGQIHFYVIHYGYSINNHQL